MQKYCDIKLKILKALYLVKEFLYDTKKNEVSASIMVWNLLFNGKSKPLTSSTQKVSNSLCSFASDVEQLLWGGLVYRT